MILILTTSLGEQNLDHCCQYSECLPQLKAHDGEQFQFLPRDDALRLAQIHLHGAQHGVRDNHPQI